MSRLFCGGTPEQARLELEAQRHVFAAHIAEQEAIVTAAMARMQALVQERPTVGAARLPALTADAKRQKTMHTDASNQLARLRAQDAALERRLQLLDADRNTVVTARLLKKTDKYVANKQASTERIAGIVANATERDGEAVGARAETDIVFAVSAAEFDQQRDAGPGACRAADGDIFDEISALLPADALGAPAVPSGPPALTMTAAPPTAAAPAQRRARALLNTDW